MVWPYSIHIPSFLAYFLSTCLIPVANWWLFGGCKIYKPIVIDMRFGKTIHWNQFSEKKTLLTDFSTNFPPSVEAFFCCSTYSVLCLPIIDRPAIYVFYPCVELKSGSSARENCHDGNTTRCAFSSGYTRWNRSKRRWDWSKCCQTIKSDRKY